MFHAFALSFVPLFIAMDAPMAVPVFATMTAGTTPVRRMKVANEAVIAASIVGVLFLLAGRAFFSVVGITENDFRVGGGLVLLVSSLLQLARPQKTPYVDNGDIASHENSLHGATPLGIPMVMGPASITTIILAAKSYGYLNTFFAIGLNLLIVWIAFKNSKYLLDLIGEKNMKVVAKLASLVLISIAVMMIRVGIKNFIG
ncbi:MAG: MarC family protein [Oligoflexia bacterium]|nr:MarC family protein [Oligoflexia bacterium]